MAKLSSKQLKYLFSTVFNSKGLQANIAKRASANTKRARQAKQGLRDFGIMAKKPGNRSELTSGFMHRTLKKFGKRAERTRKVERELRKRRVKVARDSIRNKRYAGGAALGATGVAAGLSGSRKKKSSRRRNPYITNRKRR